MSCRFLHLSIEIINYEGYHDYGELFDRKNDLDELNNLWFNEKSKDIRFKMVNRLLQENLKAQTRYPNRLAGT